MLLADQAEGETDDDLNWRKMLDPMSIAVIGASAAAAKEQRPNLGNAVLGNLLSGGFEDEGFRNVYAINPKGGEVFGRTVTPDVASLGRAPDLAVICTQAHSVLPLLEELYARGNRAVVILSEGFGEKGDEVNPHTQKTGRQMEEDLRHFIETHPAMKILGPNCLGFLCPRTGVFAWFSKKDPPQPGHVGIISASGGMKLQWVDEADISFAASIGNMKNVDEMLRALGVDEETKALALYLEDTKNFGRILRVLKKLGKPFIIRIPQGTLSQQAASTHTGAVGGGTVERMRIACEKAGGLLIDDSWQNDAAIKHLSRLTSGKCDVPPDGKFRTLITSNTGGFIVAAFDMIEREWKSGRPSLPLAQLSETCVHEVKENVPGAATVQPNRVDFRGDADGKQIVAGLEKILEDGSVDSIVVMLVKTGAMEPMAKELAAFHRRFPYKPLHVVLKLSPKDPDVLKAMTILAEADIDISTTPEEAMIKVSTAATVTSMVYRHQHAPQRQEATLSPAESGRAQQARAIVGEAGDVNLLPADATSALCALYELPYIKERFLPVGTDPEQVEATVRNMQCPLYVKISGEGAPFAHKVDIGGVAYARTPEEAAAAYWSVLRAVGEKVKDAQPKGIVFQEEAPKGFEAFVGAERDDSLEDVCVKAGFGGTHMTGINRVINLLTNNQDLSDAEILAAVKESDNLRPLFEGSRLAPLNREAFVRVVRTIAQMMRDVPQLRSIDGNPMIMPYGPHEQPVFVDLKFYLAGSGKAPAALKPAQQEPAAATAARAPLDPMTSFMVRQQEILSAFGQSSLRMQATLMQSILNAEAEMWEMFLPSASSSRKDGNGRRQTPELASRT